MKTLQDQIEAVRRAIEIAENGHREDLTVVLETLLQIEALSNARAKVIRDKERTHK